MLKQIVLACVSCTTMLPGVGTARAQEQVVVLADLPVALEPERTQNLRLLRAWAGSQEIGPSEQTGEAQEREKPKPWTEADRQREEHREEARRIYALPSPRPCQVLVWLRNGQKLQGAITEIASESFVLRQKKNKTVTISYDEIAKGLILRGMSHGWDAGEGVAMFLAVAMVVGARVWSYDATHR